MIGARRAWARPGGVGLVLGQGLGAVGLIAALALVGAVAGVAPDRASAQDAAGEARPAGVPAAAVDSLEALGRLQEAAWAAREAGDSARAERLLDRLESILRSTPRAAEPLGMDSQGVSYTFNLHHRDGVRSIFKVDGSDIFCRACGADREVASYVVDRLLGLDLTPMTVRTRIVDSAGDTLHGSAMYFIHGAATPAEAGATKPDRLRFFDAVIGNSDRHRLNWLVLGGGRVVAIDHNRAFQYDEPTRATTCWETEIDSIAQPAELGAPLARYRALPDDSLAAALAGLDPALVDRFIAMRDRVADRVRRRAEDPDRPLRHDECVPAAGPG